MLEAWTSGTLCQLFAKVESAHNRGGEGELRVMNSLLAQLLLMNLGSICDAFAVEFR